MRSLIINPVLASITVIFSFTEILPGTLVIARIATAVFMILYVAGLFRMIQTYPDLTS
ncbi:MAG: hypothetical protein WA951_12510 [Leeuwenhoekiella sp.]